MSRITGVSQHAISKVLRRVHETSCLTQGLRGHWLRTIASKDDSVLLRVMSRISLLSAFIIRVELIKGITLHWRHNAHDSVSNHQPHCLLNRLFRRRSKKISKLRVTGLCAGNSPETGEFPAQMAGNAENVSICWRHHETPWLCPYGPKTLSSSSTSLKTSKMMPETDSWSLPLQHVCTHAPELEPLALVSCDIWWWVQD